MGLNMGYFSKMTNMPKLKKRPCDVINHVIISNYNLYDRPCFKYVNLKIKNFIYSLGGVREPIEILQ